MVAVAAGTAGEPAAAPTVANEELTEFLNALKQEVRMHVSGMTRLCFNLSS